ncbi:hypothetical protein [Streptomyces sp. NPDC001889]
MSFGQGGPQWGSGGQDENPYHSRQGAPGSSGPSGTGGPPHQGAGSTPDWAALADASAARSRRRRMLLLGGGALATIAIVSLVATAIVRSSDSDGKSPRAGASELPGPQELPSDSSRPEPEFSSVAPPEAPDPKDFISSEEKDTAPLTADTLFPGRKLTMGDRAYAKGPAARAGSCAAATQGGLGTVLARNGCDQVFRATYTKDGVAVTVGVAVFGREAEAKKAARQSTGNIAPLSGSGVPVFCKGGPACLFTSNSYGRYAYFTATGYTTGTSVTTGDKRAYRAKDDLTEFVFRQIVRRGNAQASAAVAEPAG